jgi:hypothetical protein
MRKMVFAAITAAAMAGLAMGAPASALAAPHRFGDDTQLDQCTVDLVRPGVPLAAPLSQVELRPVYLTTNC